jgi:hypothetical protein
MTVRPSRIDVEAAAGDPGLRHLGTVERAEIGDCLVETAVLRRCRRHSEREHEQQGTAVEHRQIPWL